MKIGIYNPYLDTLGGGERYCFDIASCLAPDNVVDIFWNDPTIIDRAKERFRIDDVSRIRIVPKNWTHKGFFSYDIVFFVSDGSIPASFAKKTYLIFQFPVMAKKNIWTNLKMQRMTGILCYSQFVKEFLDRQFEKKAIVLPPTVDSDGFRQGKKEKLILSVGRFTKGKNTKKQEFLIDMFRTLAKNELKNWRLVLAGGMLVKDEDFIDSLRTRAKGFQVSIEPNISFAHLQALYAKAAIYWHAAGFGEDLDKHPEKAEHFGLTTLEAMSAGSVPIVFAGGGQKEVVKDGVNGFLWKTKEDLISKTLSMVSDENARTRLSRAAQAAAKDFSREQFSKRVQNLL